MLIRRINWLRWTLWLLILLWLLVTFVLSDQTADESNRTSERVIRWLLTWFDKSFSTLSPAEQLLRIGAWSFAVRKLAHFTLYTALGFLACAAFSTGSWSRWAFGTTLGLGVLIAILDEVHQSFVPGRSCELRDVGIDAAGVLLGAAFLRWILSLIQRKKLKK